MSCVVSVSEEHTASIIKAGDGDSKYLCDISNRTHFHVVEAPKADQH
jgi:hypothetical protein